MAQPLKLGRRPCVCGNVTSETFDISQCRLCWLATYDPRYRRMWGLNQEAAQAVPAGLGDAVATVAQPIARGIDWLLGTNIQKCGGCEGRRRMLNELGDWLRGRKPEVPICLTSSQSPGDIVVATGVVAALHRQFPGRFLTSCKTSAQELWHNNPLVQKVPGLIEVPLTYEGIHQSNQSGKHFMQAMADDLAEHLELSGLTIDEPKGDLYLNDGELNRPIAEPYWLVNSGVKSDYTAKAWHGYADVIKATRHKLKWVQVGALDAGRIRHIHQPIEGAVNLLGRTSHRDLLRLVYHASGVLCGVSYLMHLAAAFRKPCIVVAGGREPVAWNDYKYDGFSLFSTVGKLDCCELRACWKSRVEPLGDGDSKDHDTCRRPVDHIPECMRMISSEVVAERCMECVSC